MLEASSESECVSVRVNMSDKLRYDTYMSEHHYSIAAASNDDEHEELCRSAGGSRCGSGCGCGGEEQWQW